MKEGSKEEGSKERKRTKGIQKERRTTEKNAKILRTPTKSNLNPMKIQRKRMFS